MTVKYHKKNTNFQIEHFLMKAAHTPDNAYFQLLELKEERDMAVDSYNVGKLRREAKRMKIDEMLQGSEADKKEAEADLLEISHAEKYEDSMYEATMDELAFIQSKLDELEPKRKHGHMDLISAHEASQQEAWLEELKVRAEAYLLTTGTIPADQLITMRLHPDFMGIIHPYILEVRGLLMEESKKLI